MNASATAKSLVILLEGYEGPVANQTNNSVGWTKPNQLRRDGDYLFLMRDTRLAAEMSQENPLAVTLVDGCVRVYDEHVFMANRWWNYNHLDVYKYPYDYGIFVHELCRGAEKHRDETVDGRIIGNCAWGNQHGRFAGPLTSVPVGCFGFVDLKLFFRRGNAVYIAEGANVSPSLEGETCLQVIRLNDGFFVFDGDVPEPLRWWNRPHPEDTSRQGWPTHVKGLMREHEWRPRIRHCA